MSKIPATRLTFTTAEGSEGEIIIYVGSPQYQSTLTHYNMENALKHLTITSREEIELETQYTLEENPMLEDRR